LPKLNLTTDADCGMCCYLVNVSMRLKTCNSANVQKRRPTVYYGIPA